ncbi:MAG: DinB family protein [Bacteroidia bacterium]|nr:DinB family protein [Bacteroidia bacterium]
MLKESLVEIFERDLLKLKEEINLYHNENNLWVLKNQVSNSAGNLCLHLTGNMNHFVGAILGKTGFVRERDQEFSSKNIPRKQMIDELDKTIAIVVKTLKNLSEEDLKKNFPIPKHDRVVSMDYMLLHLLTHLNYHLGQVNYHRRLLEGI